MESNCSLLLPVCTVNCVQTLKVLSKVKNGKQLFALTKELLLSSTKADNDGGWRLRESQADNLLTAIASLQTQAEGGDIGPAGLATLDLDLYAYFPKHHTPGAKTARNSRYPFETPLFVIGV
jgi:hypothetical protein